MFDVERSAAEARRADRLRNIYHLGQHNAWDGRTLLPSLLEKHDGIHVAPPQRAALGRLFSMILWGELAAWRISAELAAEIVPLEGKMAATSQAFDEARHFYVMRDYLVALGHPPDKMHRSAERLLGAGSRREEPDPQAAGDAADGGNHRADDLPGGARDQRRAGLVFALAVL